MEEQELGTIAMSKHILIIQGHPDSDDRHLCHSLADAYRHGAREAGFEVDMIDVATLDFPVLRSGDEWKERDAPRALEDAQKKILKADHLVIIYPLWLGTMPALLKAFFEQTVRPSMVPGDKDSLGHLRSLLTGKSGRIIVTMGMPALAYRLWFRMHSVKSLQRNILGFVGVGPIFTSLIGLVDNMTPKRAERLMSQMTLLGRSAR